MKYVAASAVLRVLFAEAGPAVSLTASDRVASSELIEIEAFRAVDRERMLGNLDDGQTALKRKEPTEFLAMLDLTPMDRRVIDRAKESFRGERSRARRDPRRDGRDPGCGSGRLSRSSSGRTTIARRSRRCRAG